MRHIHDGNLPTGAHLALEAEARRAARVPKPDRGACLDMPHVTERAVAAGAVADQAASVGDFTRGIRGEHGHFKTLKEAKAGEAVSDRWGGGRFGPSQKAGECDSHHFAAGAVPAWRPQGVAPPGTGAPGDFTGGVRASTEHFTTTYAVQARNGLQGQPSAGTPHDTDGRGAPRRFHSHSCSSLVFPEVVHKSRLPEKGVEQAAAPGDFTRGFRSSGERLRPMSWEVGVVPEGGPLGGKRYSFAPICSKNYKLTEWS